MSEALRRAAEPRQDPLKPLLDCPDDVQDRLLGPLAAEHLGHDVNAWTFAVAIAPEFVGTVAELFKTAGIATS